RSVKVVDPAGSTNLYMLRQKSHVVGTNSDWLMDGTYGSDAVPLDYPPDTSIDNYNMYYRDTFHWGPRQAAGLPGDLNAITAADCRKARMRHWLHLQDTLPISQSLSMEQQPGIDGDTKGQTTWFDYDGKVNATYWEG